VNTATTIAAPFRKVPAEEGVSDEKHRTGRISLVN